MASTGESEAHLLGAEDFENAMRQLFASITFSETDFDRISYLLLQRGRAEWSYRPRHYAVLRMIDRVDLMHDLIADGFKDIFLPYSNTQLPPALQTSGVRFGCLEKQNLVLSKAKDVEVAGGRHRHFGHDADVHFEVIRKLGEGGSGVVHHVRSKLSRNELARKKLSRRRTFAGSKEAVRIFEIELSNLRRLTHHHLVQFQGSYTDIKYICLLTSPVADCDLGHFLSQTPFLDSHKTTLRKFFGCLCSAILYLHDNKCRHKDIKPANILVKNDSVLVTDFGTALDWSDRSQGATSGLPTSAYTAFYAAPEVLNETRRDMSTDIWSLGCVFLDMTTILNGKTLESQNSFLERNGNTNRIPALNQNGLLQWMNHCLVKDEDQTALKWVRLMLQQVASERITASDLMLQIHSSKSTKYYDACCAEEEEFSDYTSYQGSIYQPKSPTEANVKNLSDHTSNQRSIDQPKLMIRTDVKDRKRFGPISSRYDDLQYLLSDSSSDDGSSNASHNRSENLNSLLDINDEIGSEENFGDDSDSMESDSDSGDSLNPASRLYYGEDVNSLENGDAVDSLKNSKLLEIKITHDLLWAAMNGMEFNVRFIINKGANIEEMDGLGRTSLFLAAEAGHTSITKLLIEKDANINVRTGCDLQTPLLAAIQGNHQSTAQLLIDKGANVELKNSDGLTPLSAAAKRGLGEVINQLIIHGADVNAKADRIGSPLTQVCIAGNISVAKLLIEAGADVNFQSRYSLAPLQSAIHYDNLELASLLIENGADVNLSGIDGLAAIHYAARKQTVSAARLLIQNGADPHSFDDSRKTPLIYAVETSSPHMIRFLIRLGASTDVRCDHGLPMIMCLCEQGEEESLKAFLSAGVSSEEIQWRDDRAMNTLDVAIDNGYTNILAMLLPLLGDEDLFELLQAVERDGKLHICHVIISEVQRRQNI